MPNRRFLRSLALAAAPALTACASAPPAATVRPPIVQVTAAGSSQAVLTEMKLAAISRGWRIADEGVDSLLVDFGTANARIALGAGEAPRLTEVHGTALYIVRPSPRGAQITVIDNPIHWHPDLACWMPGPAGVVPSAALLPADAHVGTQ